MRKLFATLSAFFMMSMAVQAQIVISEILYNVPGSGENEEFIELHNAGANAVNLQNYYFTQGIIYTFGNLSVPAGGYIVVARDSAAFHNSFGMAPDAFWGSASGLSNSGEDITLYDANNGFVDSVDYDDAAPWPTIADGGGRSLQLCDLSSDNNVAANWGFNNTATGINTTTLATTDSLYATPGMANQCVVVVPPPPASYPVYTFSDINGLDTAGMADSIGVTCELRAIAHCIDLRGGSGLDFPFAQSDNSAGIRVFSFSDVDNYTVTAGDSLHIQGTVSMFGGLLQFTPDSIAVISQGNPTATPMQVSNMSEMTENRYVELTNMYIVDTAAWTGTGSGFNVQITDGSADTILVRIDNDVDLYNMPAPLGTFSIRGWGGQFDPSAPFDEGYQLQPCSMTMITNAEKVATPRQVAVYPNPTSSILTVETVANMEVLSVYNALGQEVIRQTNINTNNLQLNVADLENGIYFLQIQAEGQAMTKAFQVSK